MKNCTICFRILLLLAVILEIIGMFLRTAHITEELIIVGWMCNFTGLIIAVIAIVLLAIILDFSQN